MTKKLLLTGIIVLIASNLLAQYSVKGKILNKSDKGFIEFASVHLRQINGNYSADGISGRKGAFAFLNVPEGNYQIRYRYLGYKELADTVLITKNTVLNDVFMETAVIVLDETVIVKKRNEVDFKLDKQVVNVSRQIHAQGGTAADVLQTVPSVQVDAQGNVSLRGSTDFTLLIDGRPSVLKAEEVLNSMQAQNIRQIEVITNPSVKYQAEGSTGIINIITKKTNIKGTEGTVDASLANGNKYSANVLITKRSGKFQSYIGLGISDKTKINESWSERFSGTDYSFKENFNSIRSIRRYTHDIKIGTNWNINQMNRLSINAQAGKWQFDRGLNSSYLTNDTSLVESTEMYKNISDFISTNATFTHSFAEENHSLAIDLQFNLLDNSMPNEYSELSIPYFQEINTNAAKKNARFSFDYKLPLSKKVSMESGVLYSGNYSDYMYSFFSGTRIYEGLAVDPAYSSEMKFRDENSAAYAIVMTDFTIFQLQLGIRAEYNDRLIDIENEILHDDNYDFFPSIHLSRIIKEKHNFALSYSKRINRPNEWQLNPLVYASDRFLLKRGNPTLKDEIVHSLEMNYFFRAEKFNVNAILYAKKLFYGISSYTELIDRAFVETYDNLSKARNAGGDVMFGYNPLKWLRFNLSASMYYSDWEGVLSDNLHVEGSSVIGSGVFRSTFEFPTNSSLQFLALYYAPTNSPQGKTKSFYYFDFIFRQQLLKNKLSITLRTHNTFDTGMLYYDIVGNGFRSENRYHYEGPTFILSVNYLLNNFRKKINTKGIDIDFDSGLDH